MIRKNRLSAFSILFFVLFASTCFALEVKVGGVLEVTYSGTNANNKNLINNQNEQDTARFYTTDADVNVKVLIDENVEAFIKLDADDFSGGSVSEDSLLEEAHFTLKNIHGTSIDLKIGKQEVPFGMDKDLGISDPYVHGGSSDSYLDGLDLDKDGTVEPEEKFPHFGEVDNKFGITLTTIPIKDSPKLELCVFQNDRGQDYNDGDEPADDGLKQSYAVKLTSTRVINLKAEVSYISMHKEENDKNVGMTDDSSALSVGCDYKLAPLEIFAEGIWGDDLEFQKDYDQKIYHIGAAYDFTDIMTLVFQYNKIINENASGAPEPILEKIALTPKYKLKNGVEIALEYARETLDMDDPVNTKDVTADTVSARIAYKF